MHHFFCIWMQQPEKAYKYTEADADSWRLLRIVWTFSLACLLMHKPGLRLWSTFGLEGKSTRVHGFSQIMFASKISSSNKKDPHLHSES